MNKHVISALMDIATLFGLPILAMAGGWGLRRRFRERQPRLAFRAGTFLMGGGGSVLLAVFAIMLMMRNW